MIEMIENEYGCCPVCGMNDGYLDLGEDHWFYCREHGVPWFFGSGIYRGEGENTTPDGIPGEVFLPGLRVVPLQESWPRPTGE